MLIIPEVRQKIHLIWNEAQYYYSILLEMQLFDCLPTYSFLWHATYLKKKKSASSALISRRLVSERLLITCLPVSLGLGRNWYQLLADSQTTLPWQPPWKAFRTKRMTLSAEIDQGLNLQISLHTVWMHDQPSDCVCDVFNLLCGPLHLASECSSWRMGWGWGCGRVVGLFWSWALSFISGGDCLICSIVALW